MNGVCSPSPRNCLRCRLKGRRYVAFGDVIVIEAPFGRFGFGGVVRAAVARLGIIAPRSPVVSTTGGSPRHRVAVGSHSVGNRCRLPG